MRTIGKIHAARLDKSPRLQRFLKVLREFPNGCTTRQIQNRAHVCNPNSCAAELKAQGHIIRCLSEGRKRGSNVYRYTLLSGK